MSNKIVKESPTIKSFNCPNCAAPLKITAVGITVNVICGSCKSTIDVSNPTLKYIEGHKKARSVIPDIPLGSRGTFAGFVYECIGFIQKKDGPYYWREYLLYNPYVGFRWLVEVDGHWSITKKIYFNLEFSLRNSFSLKGNHYKIFNDSSATVDYVEGEFYWRVKKGDRTSVKDYISPPYMLSFEATTDEKSWSLGRYIESERVKEIFNLENDLIVPDGIGANQPLNSNKKLREIAIPLMIAVCFIFVVHLIRVSTASNRIIFTQTFEKYGYPSKGDEIKSRNFTIEADKKNVELELITNLTNNWLFLDVVLVDSDSGKGIPLSLETEYYKGYTGGENWSEGNRKASKISFNIPKGNYFLSIIPHSGTKNTNQIRFTTELSSDIVLMRNWVIALMLILIYPLLILFKSRGQEARRWENSDFSSYGG